MLCVSKDNKCTLFELVCQLYALIFRGDLTMRKIYAKSLPGVISDELKIDSLLTAKRWLMVIRIYSHFPYKPDPSAYDFLLFLKLNKG